MRSVACILALVLAGCAPSLAQHVQHCTSGTFNTNPTCALPSPVTVGNKLITIVIEGNGAGSPGVTDTLGNTFGAGILGNSGWTIGFTGAQCGAGSGGGGFCFNTLYPAPVTIGGADTVTYNSGGGTNVYWMYVGEYAGIGSFDVVGSACAGGLLVPCNVAPSGGSQSVSVATATTTSFLFAVAACDYDTSVGAPGCSAAPTNTTGTFRANVYAGGCPNPTNCMQPTFFDDLGGPPGTYTETANVGATTNWSLSVWSFGFTAASGVPGEAQIL